MKIIFILNLKKHIKSGYVNNFNPKTLPTTHKQQIKLTYNTKTTILVIKKAVIFI